MVAPVPPAGDGEGAAGARSMRNKLRRAFQVARGADEALPESAVTSPARPAAEPARPSMREFLLQRRERLAAQAAEPAAGASQARGARVALPDAEVLDTPHGPLWRRELRYPLSHRHGVVPLQRGRDFDPARLAVLARDEALTALEPQQCLFLDTETTGLSGGAGTVVFAYGLAFFDGDEVVFEQLFLRDFGEEPAMLHHLAQRLAEHPVPVTFVGKSYDRHRIAARLAVHRIQAPVLTERHVDLYHVVRRRHGKQWPDTRLRTAEQRLLGLVRHDDLPGSEAPAAFLGWVRDGRGPVDRVLEHNRLDVLSLVALLGAVLAPDAPP